MIIVSSKIIYRKKYFCQRGNFQKTTKKGIKKKPADKYLGLDDCLKRLLLEIVMQYPCNYL